MTKARAALPRPDQAQPKITFSCVCSKGTIETNFIAEALKLARKESILTRCA